jgi:hypothetical protein
MLAAIRSLKIIFVISLVFFTFNCDAQEKKPVIVGKWKSESILYKFIGDSLFQIYKADTISLSELKIQSDKRAIKIAEKKLFKEYGKSTIREERPYEVYLSNGIWLISGALNEGVCGGVFYAAIEGKSGKVILVYHTK